MTNFRMMTDGELLRACNNRRGFSPLIDELTRRLEDRVDADIENLPAAQRKFNCPVCESGLLLDASDGILNVGATKP